MKTLIALLLLSTQAFALSGYDESSDAIEIHPNEQVQQGRSISAYDYGDRDYHDVEVQNIRDNGNGTVNIEVYDLKTHDYSTYQMRR